MIYSESFLVEEQVVQTCPAKWRIETCSSEWVNALPIIQMVINNNPAISLHEIVFGRKMVTTAPVLETDNWHAFGKNSNLLPDGEIPRWL